MMEFHLQTNDYDIIQSLVTNRYMICNGILLCYCDNLILVTLDIEFHKACLNPDIEY